MHQGQTPAVGASLYVSIKKSNLALDYISDFEIFFVLFESVQLSFKGMVVAKIANLGLVKCFFEVIDLTE